MLLLILKRNRDRRVYERPYNNGRQCDSLMAILENFFEDAHGRVAHASKSIEAL